MKMIYNKFLIVSTILLIVGGVYLYFSGDINKKEIIPVAYGSSLSSSLGINTTDVTSALREKISADIAFLNTLVSLKRIQIDDSLFISKSFNLLVNNKVEIESVIAGRSNPFSPFSTNNNIVSTPDVNTNQPTQINDKTVTLNGAVNITNGVGDTYFEYGDTQNLGIITSTVKPSLVGVFSNGITGLISKTTYFYKACAKINNTKLCGEIISFTTN